MNTSVSVNIKGIPATMWARVKVLAIQRRVTVKSIVVRALTDYLAKVKE